MKWSILIILALFQVSCTNSDSDNSKNHDTSIQGDWNSHFDFSKTDTTNQLILELRAVVLGAKVVFKLEEDGTGNTIIESELEDPQVGETFEWSNSGDKVTLIRNGKPQEFIQISPDTLMDLTYSSKEDNNYPQHYLVR
jgi:hypothetical protein